MTSIISKQAKRFVSVKQYLKFLENIKLPERWKGGRIEKYVEYWKGLSNEYKDVFVDVYTDAVTKPRKAAAIVAAMCGFVYAMKTNPDEHSFQDALLKHNNDLLQVSDAVRNSASNRHINLLIKCHNEGLLRRFSLGVVSLIWIDNYDELCDMYQTQCSYLKPRYITFYERIVDIGFCGKWLMMEEKMDQFDVNLSEWEPSTNVQVVQS